MATRMIHPQHGATHAYTVTEVEFLKTRGWEVEVPAVDLEPAKPTSDTLTLHDAPKKKPKVK